MKISERKPNLLSNFVTNNYLNLRGRELYNIKIQFAYFNNDSKLDLVFTANNFVDGNNNLYYALNEGQQAFQFSTLVKHSFRYFRQRT